MISNYILTQDGSYTLFNREAHEHYHSISGAYTEAYEKYIVPLGIKNGHKILDFCFGLGYNSFVAISKFSNIEITALEKDINVIKEIAKFPYPKKLTPTVEFFKDLAKNNVIIDNKQNKIKLLLRDARISIKTLPAAYFDRIFFDPFSPKKAPELWSYEIFRTLYNLLKQKGKLATYSCAKQIRKNMEEAGFKVYDGPSIGRKNPSTIAIKE